VSHSYHQNFWKESLNATVLPTVKSPSYKLVVFQNYVIKSYLEHDFPDIQVLYYKWWLGSKTSPQQSVINQPTPRVLLQNL